MLLIGHAIFILMVCAFTAFFDCHPPDFLLDLLVAQDADAPGRGKDQEERSLTVHSTFISRAGGEHPTDLLGSALSLIMAGPKIRPGHNMVPCYMEIPLNTIYD